MGLIASCFVILVTRPVFGGNYVTLAALKDVIRTKAIPSFSKASMASAFLHVDLAERLLGNKKVKNCQIGQHIFEVQNASIAKNLLIDVFIRQDYYFPYTAATPFIIDCGANVGFSVAYFKMRFPQAKILAFEPDPENFALLQKNLAHATFSNIELRKQAVAENAGQVAFVGNATVGGIIESGHLKNSFFVEAVKLSDEITEIVDILKMDIEGAEAGVLHELASSNKLPIIKNIIMEYHYTADNQNALGESLALLARNGFNYQIKSVSGMSQPFDSSIEVQKRLNCLMIYAYKKS